MTLQRTDKVFFSTREDYIDKTQVIEKGIKTFSSIFIEGAAASGKTVGVNMLIQKQKGINFVVFFMDKERDDRTFIRKLTQIRNRMEQEKIWVICEDMNLPISDIKARALVDFVHKLCGDNRCIFVSREKPHRKFLDLIWKEKMYLITQKSLLFTIEEIDEICKTKRLSIKAREIYQVTGGWPGCVSLMIRIFEKAQKYGSRITIDELRERYEIAEYIDGEILGTLSKLEKDFLEIGGWCPWFNEKMCQDIWKVSGGAETIENLVRKGFLTETEKEKYSTALLFKQEVCRKPPEKIFWTTVGQWYEAESFIEEAFFAMRRTEDYNLLRDFAIRNYAEIPFIDMGFEPVKEWTDNIPELCFVRGMQCYFELDLFGMNKEIRKIEKHLELRNDKKTRDIYLNLLYARPDFPLEQWLDLLEKQDDKEQKVQLYNILGGSNSYLCGLRDLSELFSCSRKEENQKMRIWKENLDPQAGEWYQLAHDEYYMEISQEKKTEEEDMGLIQKLRDGEEEIAAEVTEKNFLLLYRYGKAYLKMRQYDKAEKIFVKLIPFLKLGIASLQKCCLKRQSVSGKRAAMDRHFVM